VQKSDKKSKSAAPAKPKQEEKVKNGIGTGINVEFFKSTFNSKFSYFHE
jgi:hypothetical protein